ncbi:MAG TPA: Coq4 family protein [Rhizomicrobium sp.]|nr:Coq4 family protein [Rhizomicrobium sp.]
MTQLDRTLEMPLAKTQSNLGIQPLRALKALRKLINNKEDTAQVFEIMRALSGRATPRGYRRMLETPEGGKQAYLRVELADKLQDREWLAQFAPGTVGAAYRAFIAPRDLSAYGLAEESRKMPDANIDAAHPIAWYARRLRDVHDVWHVLTGYNTDALGEACVVAFSYAQTGNFGFGFIALAGAHQFEKLKRGYPYFKAILQGYRRGKAAKWLPAEDYEKLFAEPLEAARKRLGITPAPIYDAIPQADREPPFALAAM